MGGLGQTTRELQAQGRFSAQECYSSLGGQPAVPECLPRHLSLAAAPGLDGGYTLP